MPDPILVRNPAWFSWLIDGTRLGGMLTDCMIVQPELDPEAGFGVFQACAMIEHLALSEEQTDALINRSLDLVAFYVTLRAATLLFMTPEKFSEDLADDTPFDYPAMIKYIAGICKSFNVELASRHLTEVKANANSKKPKHRSPRRGRKVTPRNSRSRKGATA